MTAPSIPSMKQAAEVLKTYRVEGAKTAVIIGGAQGIGAAVTPLLAHIGCSKIIILGRNEQKGAEMVQLAKSRGPEGMRPDIQFIRADVATVKGMRQAVKDIGAATGKGGIDYLLEFQNGVPSGRLELTSDNIEKGLAVQAVSRFFITYLLAEGEYLAPNAISFTLANPGQDMPTLEMDDLNLEKLYDNGNGGGIGYFFKQSARDSCVLDSIYLELQRRYPQYRFFHGFPGLVTHETFSSEGLPWQARLLFGIGRYTIATTAEYIATMPIYGITHPDDFGEVRFLDNKMQPKEPSPWAVKNSAACWEKLREITGVE